MSYDSINWVNLLVNSIGTEWLVDTGASISAVKRNFLRNNALCCKIIKEELVINGVGGSLRAIGYVYLKLEYGRCSFMHKFYIFDDSRI